jgi:hypothetical protein
MTQDFDLRRAPYHAYGQSRFTTRTMTAFAFIQDGLRSIHGFWAVGRQFGHSARPGTNPVLPRMGMFLPVRSQISASYLFKETAAMCEEPPVHPSAPEVAEERRRSRQGCWDGRKRGCGSRCLQRADQNWREEGRAQQRRRRRLNLPLAGRKVLDVGRGSRRTSSRNQVPFRCCPFRLSFLRFACDLWRRGDRL